MRLWANSNAWISKWFSEDLILAALNEAIKNNAPSLRYIDKILFEWGKKGYKSVDDIKKYNRVDEITYKKEKEFETRVFDYNWLDDD